MHLVRQLKDQQVKSWQVGDITQPSVETINLVIFSVILRILYAKSEVPLHA
jgi:hypothetical protein